MVFQQIRMIFLGILAVIRRALCCFSRRRSPSFSEPITVRQDLNVVIIDNNYHNTPTLAAMNTRSHQQRPERDWNSWDDSPRTVEEHIEQYRQKIAKPPTPHCIEPEPDFFSELTPVIKPQLKFYLNNAANEKTDFSRLEAKTDVPITLNAELEDWEDEDYGGWDELSTEQTKQMIREKRRELRNQRMKSQRSVDFNGQSREFDHYRYQQQQQQYQQQQQQGGLQQLHT